LRACGAAGSRRLLAIAEREAAAVLLFGGLTGVQSAPIAAGEATPWLGVVERAMSAAFFCWIVAISGKIWRGYRLSMPPR